MAPRLIGTFVRVEGIPRAHPGDHGMALEHGGRIFRRARAGAWSQRRVHDRAQRSRGNTSWADDAAEREATPGEIEAMKDLLRQGIADGAMGYTINRNLRPLPGRRQAPTQPYGQRR